MNNSNEKFKMLLDIPMHVTVELGSTTMQVDELLQISSGAIIELDKLVGEPLEIKVNGKLVARGETLVVNEKFGIRITEIVADFSKESLPLKQTG
jgi:flagellar motor switch protein FliN